VRFLQTPAAANRVRARACLLETYRKRITTAVDHDQYDVESKDSQEAPPSHVQHHQDHDAIHSTELLLRAVDSDLTEFNLFVGNHARELARSHAMCSVTIINDRNYPTHILEFTNNLKAHDTCGKAQRDPVEGPPDIHSFGSKDGETPS
jgi:hypothetical protein